MQTGHFASAPDAVQLIVKKEGFKGLYAVSNGPLLEDLPSNSFMFFIGFRHKGGVVHLFLLSMRLFMDAVYVSVFANVISVLILGICTFLGECRDMDPFY